MNARPDLIVVGAGLSGLLTALRLNEAGAKPLVVPGPDVPELLPQLETCLLPPGQWPAVISQLEVRGLRLFPELITRLAQETGVDLSLERRSLLLPGKDGSADMAVDDPVPSRSVSGQVADFEPQLAEGQTPAICFRDRPVIRVDRLQRALQLALVQREVVVLGHRQVKRLNVAGNIVLGVELDRQESIEADATVIAADQASNRLLFDSGLEPLGGAAKLAPALQFAPSSAALSCDVHETDLLLSPRRDGRVVAISNLDSDQRVMLPPSALRRRVHHRLPGLGRHDLERSGRLPVPVSGLRAAVGAYPAVRGFWLNVGHDVFGPVIAESAAEFLIEQLNGGPAVSDLAVTLSRSMQPSC